MEESSLELTNLQVLNEQESLSFEIKQDEKEERELLNKRQEDKLVLSDSPLLFSLPHFPKEVFTRVITFLDLKDCLICCSVCKEWKAFFQVYILNWKFLFEEQKIIQKTFKEIFFEEDLILILIGKQAEHILWALFGKGTVFDEREETVGTSNFILRKLVFSSDKLLLVKFIVIKDPETQFNLLEKEMYQKTPRGLLVVNNIPVDSKEKEIIEKSFQSLDSYTLELEKSGTNSKAYGEVISLESNETSFIKVAIISIIDKIWKKAFNVVAHQNGNKIESAPLVSLIHLLVFPPPSNLQVNWDPIFYQKFFITVFESFLKEEALFMYLFIVYHRMNRSENLLSKTEKEKLQIIILNVLKKITFGRNNKLSKQSVFLLNLFLNTLISGTQTSKLSEMAKQLRVLVNKTSKTNSIPSVSPVPLKPAQLPKNSENLKLLDLSPLEFAKQLTIKEYEVYNSIHSSEFLNMGWHRNKNLNLSPNIRALITNSNKFALWIGNQILNMKEVAKRASLYTYFVKVCKYLRKMNNFSTLVTFIAGLQNSSIERLKWTQNEVPAKVKKLLNELSGEIGPVRGYQQLRMALNSLTLPAIPFIGLYLADVTFVQDGNSDVSNKCLNLVKQELVYTCIVEALRFQNHPYNFTTIEKVQELLTSEMVNLLSQQETFQLSLQLEPKGAERSDIK